AAASTGSTGAGNDIAQGTGSQPFVRQANEERSGFENRGGSNFGSQERPGTQRNERSDESTGGGGSSLSGRERY
ncbi:MAG: hypothetical protein ACLGH0_15940, partial [Thermoanaerobaculia bacterium]